MKSERVKAKTGRYIYIGSQDTNVQVHIKAGQVWPCGVYVPKAITNADRLRAMTDEELAEFVCSNSINTMCDIICGGWCNSVATLKKSADEMCKEIVIKWLQQPVEGGDG